MSEFNILVYLIRILEVVIVELDMFKMGTELWYYIKFGEMIDHIKYLIYLMISQIDNATLSALYIFNVRFTIKNN